ncbi:hypothetical protein ACQEV9_07500 [Streptomyces chartreusis]|uniref:hypothetical protein n=1 Tax=Streptomyces chartreusis TaxID=1969 RepID=UPI003D8B1275
MITDEDIRMAETRVSEVKERGARLRMANRDDVADAINLEMGRLVELRERKAQQDAAPKVRKTAERSHASDLKGMGAELESSASTVDKARENAARALEELVSALRAHNATVGAVHTRLNALGLPLADDAVDQYESGAGHAGVLRVGGTTWAQVPVDAMLEHAVAEVVKREFGAKHPGARSRDIRLHSLRRGSVGALRIA